MMKRIVSVAILLTVGVVAFLALVFLPPREWRNVHVGMSRAQVRQIIPSFDQPWGDIKADFHHKDCGLAVWRLAVGWQGDHVDMVERELWTKWPERRRVRSIIEQ